MDNLKGMDKIRGTVEHGDGWLIGATHGHKKEQIT